MKLRIVCCSDDYSQDEYIIRSLDSSDHVFVVPDRLAMSYEKKLFEVSGEEASFNKEVLTMARLAASYRIVDNVIGKLGGVMIVKRLLSEHRDEFKAFKNCLSSMGFAEVIYNTIAQFKSCNISPDVVCSFPKLDDLGLIYKAYEDFISDRYVDSQDELNIYGDKIKSSGDIDINFYFCHFDSLTSQGYDILRELIKKSKSVTVSIQHSEGLNGYIYQRDFENKVLEIAGELGLQPEIIDIPSVLPKVASHLQSNLLAHRPMKISTDTIKLFEGAGLREELEYVAKESLKLIKVNGYRYRDISIAIPSLADKQQLVRDVLTEYGLKYYIDTDVSFRDTIVYKFITSLNNLLCHGGMVDVLDFGGSPFVIADENLHSQFDDVIMKYKFNKRMLIENDVDSEGYRTVRDCILTKVLPLDHIYNDSTPISKLNAIMRDLLNAIDMKGGLDKLATKYIEGNMLYEQRILVQEWDVLDETLSLLDDLMGESSVTGEEYLNIVLSGLASQTLSTVPLCVDNMFVSDLSNVMANNPKVLFVLGADASSLPVSMRDNGIISDTEIEDLKDKFVLEPSVYKINLRSRQRAVNLIASAKDRLYVSYSVAAGATKSDILLSLEDIVTDSNGDPIKYYTGQSSDLSFIENMACLKHAKHEVVALLRKVYDGQQIDIDKYIDYISYIVSKGLDRDLFTYENAYRLANPPRFHNDRVSVSEAEMFYTCPFKHFMSYTVGLKEREDYLIDSKTIGSILHRVAERYSQARPMKEIRAYAYKTFDDIVKSEYHDLMIIPSNRVLLAGIREEAVMLCEAIEYQLKNSSFSLPHNGVEVRFGANNRIKALTMDVMGMKVTISGVVDRVDELQDYFRVIDYKTGTTDGKLRELYYGKKIQLYVYGYVVSKSILKKCCGVYYLPVRRDFSKDGSRYAQYKLSGDTINNNDVILASDNRLNTNDNSDIINVRKKKSAGDESYDSRSSIISEEELLSRMEYAMSMLKQACVEILNGNIQASPLDMGGIACEHCPYKSICRYDTLLGNRPRKALSSINKLAEVKYE